MRLISPLIQKINKAELHRHLDCSMRFSRMLEVASKIKMPIPLDLEAQRDFFLLKTPAKDLKHALSKFNHAQQLLLNKEILEDLAFDTVIEGAGENIRLMELRYAPTFVQQKHQPISWEQIHQAFLSGINKALQIHTNMAVGLILIIQRNLDSKTIESLIDFAIENKESLIGIDLADDEDGFEAKIFQSPFNRAKNAGFHITVHAGEVPTQQSIKNIEDSIQLLHADRIGHGVQAIHSKKIMRLLIDKKIPLEVCPSSNYLTQAFPKREDHPVKMLINEGVTITINTDDPGIFDYTLSEELEYIHQNFNIDLSTIKQLQFNAFQYSFIPSKIKTAMNVFN